MDSNHSEKNSYRLLTDHALRALRDQGWDVAKAPGHGRSNVWRIQRGNESGLVSIRTTKDRWIAYQPQEGGEKWKTLNVADYVCISALAYDAGRQDPIGIDVYLVDAGDVRKSFASAYEARTGSGHTVTDNFGMWVAIDPFQGDNPAYQAGSGLISEANQIGRYRQFVRDAESSADVMTPPPPPGFGDRKTVATILQAARAEIALVTGVPYEAISLDLTMST